MSSMIHSARPTVSLAANIVCFVLFCYIWKDVQTDDMCESIIPTGRDCGLAEWINSRIEH